MYPAYCPVVNEIGSMMEENGWVDNMCACAGICWLYMDYTVGCQVVVTCGAKIYVVGCLKMVFHRRS